MSKPLAVCCSDTHLTARVPKCWHKDVWMSAQANMLRQINTIALEHNVGLLVAGDVFDRAKEPPKIEIMAMNYLQTAWLVPGQHDMPQHNPELLDEASYGVLSKFNTPRAIDLDIYEFPWGAELVPLEEQEKTPTKLTCAVVHALVWQGEEPYPGAPKKGNVQNLVKLLHGYDFIVAGDNHKGFVTKVDDTVIVNCGSTMRRNVGQINYQPCVHVIFDDKTVESIPLDISKDKISTEHKDKTVEKEDRIDAFVETLKEDVEISLSFQSNLERYMEANDVEQPVKDLIMETLDANTV